MGPDSGEGCWARRGGCAARVTRQGHCRCMGWLVQGGLQVGKGQHTLQGAASTRAVGVRSADRTAAVVLCWVVLLQGLLP